MKPRDDGRIEAKVDTRDGRRYDYRKGVMYGLQHLRGYQPRKDGPPLLFATDRRMTLLVHLALASGPVRRCWLWRHLGGRRYDIALSQLVAFGLVAKWKLGPHKAFLALDPCHPAAEPLRELLIEIGRIYGFKPIPLDVEAEDGGDAPVRPSRRRDVRTTFGDRGHTMALLLVYILGEASATDVMRCLSRATSDSQRYTLAMYQAFGILKSRWSTSHKRSSILFRLNLEHPLAEKLWAVLAALDRFMPQWRAVAERQRNDPLPRGDDKKDGRRKHGRWKW